MSDLNKAEWLLAVSVRGRRGGEGRGLHAIRRMTGTMMTVYMANARPSDEFSTMQWDGYRHDFALLVCVGWTAVCCLGGEVLSSAVATATSNSTPGIRARGGKQQHIYVARFCMRIPTSNLL